MGLIRDVSNGIAYAVDGVRFRVAATLCRSVGAEQEVVEKAEGHGGFCTSQANSFLGSLDVNSNTLDLFMVNVDITDMLTRSES